MTADSEGAARDSGDRAGRRTAAAGVRHDRLGAGRQLSLRPTVVGDRAEAHPAVGGAHRAVTDPPDRAVRAVPGLVEQRSSPRGEPPDRTRVRRAPRRRAGTLETTARACGRARSGRSDGHPAAEAGRPRGRAPRRPDRRERRHRPAPAQCVRGCRRTGRSACGGTRSPSGLSRQGPAVEEMAHRGRACHRPAVQARGSARCPPRRRSRRRRHRDAVPALRHRRQRVLPVWRCRDRRRTAGLVAPVAATAARGQDGDRDRRPVRQPAKPPASELVRAGDGRYRRAVVDHRTARTRAFRPARHPPEADPQGHRHARFRARTDPRPTAGTRRRNPRPRRRRQAPDTAVARIGRARCRREDRNPSVRRREANAPEVDTAGREAGRCRNAHRDPQRAQGDPQDDRRRTGAAGRCDGHGPPLAARRLALVVPGPSDHRPDDPHAGLGLQHPGRTGRHRDSARRGDRGHEFG